MVPRLGTCFLTLEFFHCPLKSLGIKIWGGEGKYSSIQPYHTKLYISGPVRYYTVPVPDTYDTAPAPAPARTFFTF